MAAVKASSISSTPITLRIEVEGVALSQLEAQKLAKRMASSMSYDFGVDEEALIVEITAAEAAADPKKQSPKEFADAAEAAAAAEMEG